MVKSTKLGRLPADESAAGDCDREEADAAGATARSPRYPGRRLVLGMLLLRERAHQTEPTPPRDTFSSAAHPAPQPPSTAQKWRRHKQRPRRPPKSSWTSRRPRPPARLAAAARATNWHDQRRPPPPRCTRASSPRLRRPGAPIHARECPATPPTMIATTAAPAQNTTTVLTEPIVMTAALAQRHRHRPLRPPRRHRPRLRPRRRPLHHLPRRRHPRLRFRRRCHHRPRHHLARPRRPGPHRPRHLRHRLRCRPRSQRRLVRALSTTTRAASARPTSRSTTATPTPERAAVSVPPSRAQSTSGTR